MIATGLQKRYRLRTGASTIYAMAMTRREYNESRGWTLIKNENNSDEGYSVSFNLGENPPIVVWFPSAIFHATFRET